ncbi:hypothetical protein AXG93_638s1260 [Marchantia polymorpha subsp. ruderalis]|uniref:Uncharacterized protein n=1 Tax=Marchantia polymorpha subsp. ruderalis TaxID=1480154 RepID=A0A176W535_MARPO|nr:hypothetical protein AXG93_638s1260 [Marchantia polymorpha subsp. ruderalis]
MYGLMIVDPWRSYIRPESAGSGRQACETLFPLRERQYQPLEQIVGAWVGSQQLKQSLGDLASRNSLSRSTIRQ